MARTGEDRNKAAENQYRVQGNTAFDAAQSNVGNYNANIAKLESGQNVGADPWASSSYLANQNRLQSDSLNAAGNSATKSLQDLNARTGGLNAGGTTAATDSLALGKMRLANQLNAQRSAADFDKNVGYQQQLASAPLATDSTEASLFDTATKGRSGTLGDLTKEGMQSQDFWNQLAMKGVNAATSAAGGAAGGA